MCAFVDILTHRAHRSLQVFHILRSLSFAKNCRWLLKAPLRDRVKQEVVWQVEQGMALTPEQVSCSQVLDCMGVCHSLTD